MTNECLPYKVWTFCLIIAHLKQLSIFLQVATTSFDRTFICEQKPIQYNCISWGYRTHKGCAQSHAAVATLAHSSIHSGTAWRWLPRIWISAGTVALFSPKRPTTSARIIIRRILPMQKLSCWATQTPARVAAQRGPHAGFNSHTEPASSLQAPQTAGSGLSPC